MSSVQQQNFVHLDENWRQRLRTEWKTNKRFDSEWGFLTQSDTQNKVNSTPHATHLVKYFNPRGGTWTVQSKRVQANHAEDLPAMTADRKKRLLSTSMRSSQDSAVLSHSLHLDRIETANAAFNTTNGSYGSRLPMEMFGVAAYGRRKLYDITPMQ